MPATCITVASNAKQSQRAPLLVPASTSLDPSAFASAQSLVFKAAQSKLRLKKPVRIYVAGTGQELVTGDDWKHVLKDGVVLLVSAGEEYVGSKKEDNGKHREYSLPAHTRGSFPVKNIWRYSNRLHLCLHCTALYHREYYQHVEEGINISHLIGTLREAETQYLLVYS